MRKTLQRILFGFFIFLFLLLLWVGINSFDQEDFDDLGMLSQIQYPSDKNNGYAVLLTHMEEQGSMLLSSDTDKLREQVSFENYDPDFIDQVVESNANLYLKIEEAVAKSDFAFPEVKTAMDIPAYPPFIDANRYLLLKIAYHYIRDEKEDLLNALELSILLSTKVMSESGHTLISYFIGMHMLEGTLSYIKYYLREEDYFSLSDLDRLRIILEAVVAAEKLAFPMSFTGEYRFLFNRLTTPLKMGIQERMDEFHGIYGDFNTDYSRKILFYLYAIYPYYFIHPNAALDELAHEIKELQKQSKLWCKDVPNRYAHPERDSFLLRLLPGSVVDVEKYKDTFASLFSRRCHSLVNIEAVNTMIGLRNYTQKHRTLPSSLKALVPEYLKALPVDYFDGQALRYNRKAKTLYSLGMNIIDGGGSADGVYIGRCKESAPCFNNPTFLIDWGDS